MIEKFIKWLFCSCFLVLFGVFFLGVWGVWVFKIIFVDVLFDFLDV